MRRRRRTHKQRPCPWSGALFLASLGGELALLRSAEAERSSVTVRLHGSKGNGDIDRPTQAMFTERSAGTVPTDTDVGPPTQQTGESRKAGGSPPSPSNRTGAHHAAENPPRYSGTRRAHWIGRGNCTTGGVGSRTPTVSPTVSIFSGHGTVSPGLTPAGSPGGVKITFRANVLDARCRRLSQRQCHFPGGRQDPWRDCDRVRATTTRPARQRQLVPNFAGPDVVGKITVTIKWVMSGPPVANTKIVYQHNPKPWWRRPTTPSR